MSNSFNAVNPATGKLWTRQELWNVLEQMTSTTNRLRDELKELKENQEVATPEQILAYCKEGLRTHNREFVAAVVDVVDLGSKARQASEPVLAKFSKVYGELTLATGFTK